MPNSLKCKIKHLCHNGTLTERERDRILKALGQESVLDKIRIEISKSKTEHEMQISEKDIKAKLLISDIYCDIVHIIDKYKAESEE